MKYIILGGNGFIGSYIVDVLLENNQEVTVFDIAGEKFRKPLPSVNYIYGSIDDHQLLKDIFKENDILIHCISTTVPLTSNKNIEYDIETNLLNSVKIFRIACEQNIKRIVYLSSGGAIYGEINDIFINESAPTHPISSYGIVKLAIEKYLAYFSSNYGIEYNIVRPSNPYGPRQNPFNNQGVISVFLGKILNDEAIEVWGDGEISKDYVFVNDLADSIFQASICTEISQIFNIGSGKSTSINEIIKIIKGITKKEFTIKYHNTNKFDVKNVCLDIQKAKDKLNYLPKVDLVNGIEKTWEFLNNSTK
ncbi:NAD-dependent epimerase/dehydratase family protein [uncultured Chryseobacterium sp.]|uniref:NAD-dependent epimerase/dehydratase family protein n=1 Tax=uncultured Chryseobacterium sp. TaxID=259322 RepID=UPI0025D0CD53|nr:NAD-dependent epimerase/dehydratase family protein [uncultured Chryseobacterium sp.]